MPYRLLLHKKIPTDLRTQNSLIASICQRPKQFAKTAMPRPEKHISNR